VTEVHLQYRRLDPAAPVVLVEVDGRAYAALDSEHPEDAADLLGVLLLARYGPDGWNIAAPSAS
jgi:hypothetical protein